MHFRGPKKVVISSFPAPWSPVELSAMKTNISTA
jgi:hypothetical protein